MIHCTNETFGALKQIKMIESIGPETYIWKIPRARQYFIDGVFYREESERRATWYELFADLILIGAIGKSKYLITYSWFSYFQFVLVFTCLISHWIQSMMYILF